MLKSRSIVKFYSIFFLILMLCSLIGSASRPLVSKELSKNKEISLKSDDSQGEKDQNKDSPKEKLIAKPFNAVVNVGVQWDFQKQLCFVADFVVFFIPKKINISSQRFITPLPYFVTLFHTSICVNAP